MLPLYLIAYLINLFQMMLIIIIIIIGIIWKVMRLKLNFSSVSVDVDGLMRLL